MSESEEQRPLLPAHSDNTAVLQKRRDIALQRERLHTLRQESSDRPEAIDEAQRELARLENELAQLQKSSGGGDGGGGDTSDNTLTEKSALEIDAAAARDGKRAMVHNHDTDEQSRTRAARANWDKVLNVMEAARKWKNRWISSRTAVASAILEEESKARSPTTETLREQILQLRSSLYALRKKKHPTEKEEEMIKKLQARLKLLDGQYQQHLRSKHSEMLDAVAENELE